MLDRKLIRENPKIIKDNLKNRNQKIDVDGFLQKDLHWRELKNDLDSLRAERNSLGLKISELKKNKKDAEKEITTSSKISKKIKDIEEEIISLEKWLKDFELNLPNIISDTTPIGKNENQNNEIEKWGKPEKSSKDVIAHDEFGKFQDILDFDRGSKLSGHRFTVLKGWGARLERAIIQFMLDLQTSNGYREILPPFLVRGEIMQGTGQLPKFSDDLYQTNDDLWLIPTAEVPLTNLYSGEILEEKDLPMKLTAYTPCFRREAGAYGKDIKGYIRQHQFDKVELVKFSHPLESFKELELMVKDAEEVLKLLEIPYRVIELCSGDIGFSSAKTYDLEVWIPSQNTYREVSSCSNCTDFQSRRANIRFRNREGKLEFVHTLNGSGVAVPRLFVSILENYQEDKIFIVPKALRKYMGIEEIALSKKT
ncbi:MAG: serine--tRNA ligase [Candidatus Micrarchaeia archaeon]